MAREKAKVLISLALSMVLALPAHALECDTSTIEKTERGYLYSESCHIRVGQVVEELDLMKERVDTLQKRIELKDLTIDNSDRRAQMWMDTSLKLEEQYRKRERMSDWEKVLYFSLGIVVTGLAVHGAGQLN